MPHPSAGSAIPLRVLVVDDSAWLRQGIRGVLERAGLVVVGEAADGGQALAQAAAKRPDVVLMDLCMPEMNGIQATQALRHQQPELRVVLWTGEDDAHLASAIRKSGAHAGVPKGIPTVELIATLQKACTARRGSASW
jgi:DNA-binding NarL/FixJ family response regulator